MGVAEVANLWRTSLSLPSVVLELKSGPELRLGQKGKVVMEMLLLQQNQQYVTFDPIF